MEGHSERIKRLTRERNRSAERTVETLAFYFRTAFEASGLTWQDDNETEVRRAVHSLMDAVSDEAGGAISDHGRGGF